MIQIESKLKTRSRVWITPVLLIVLAFFAIAVVTPTAVFAGPKNNVEKCNDKKDNDGDELVDADDPDCGGDDASEDAPDSYNLARASFNNFGGSGSGAGGISADGRDFCTISRPSGPTPVTYDYWAWQEGLLSTEESIHVQHSNSGGIAGKCNYHDSRSDVSGGGRWFLITTAGPDTLNEVVRWLVFDFSEEVEFNIDEDLWELVPDNEKYCPDLDGVRDIYGAKHPSKNADPCVDHLTVRFPANRILKNNATTQEFDISIRHQPDFQYWPPWGALQYLEPLYIRAPSDYGAFAGRDCTVMSTRPAPEAFPKNNPPHDKMVAELYSWNSPSSGELIGTYNMPLEVCVIRTSD